MRTTHDDELDRLARWPLYEIPEADDAVDGWGIFEILSGGEGYARYLPNGPVMDLAPFRQSAKTEADRSAAARSGATAQNQESS